MTQPGTVECPNCGGENPGGAKFCNACGVALAPGCPACGHVNAPESKFCNECGTALVPAPAAAGANLTPAALAAALPPMVSEGPPPLPPPGGAAAEEAAAQAASGLTGVAGLTGERKQVTVMFADVTGFTSMSEQLDAEDVHTIINRCFEILVREVHRYEGTINQFTGDGIMALFGAPIARADSPQRAVLAALSIQRALEDLADDIKAERGITFRMRIGLNTGMAVVGAVGSQSRQDYTAVGDTTNLAARMEQMAEPGTILITEYTHRLVEHDFICEALGPRNIKGKADPVSVYRVRGLAIGHAHDGLHGQDNLTSFTGRDEEIRLLHKHVERALAGEGRVIGVVGDAGIGKSRLVHEVLAGIDRCRVAVAEGHCLSYSGGVAYMPFLDMLRDLESSACEEACTCATDPLRRLAGTAVAQRMGRGDLTISSLLLNSAQTDDVGPASDGARRETFSHILNALFEISTKAPLLLVIEDLQWIDPTSEQLLGDLVRELAGKRICLICTFTTGYHFPWADRSYYRHITLDPLTSDASATIVRSLLGGARVPPELLALVQEETEGNPHYIEASLRMLQEDGFLEQTPEGVRIARPLSEAHIPDSIQDIVMTEIDRLAEPVKRTLQVAAVVGRVFDAQLLRVVLQVEHLEPQIDALIAAELVTSRGAEAYVFRQGVTRDVAYNSLLRSRRRELHHRVGLAMEWVYADRLHEVYPQLGHHFAEGADAERAIHYLRRGALSSRSLGAMQEGAELLDQVLILVETLPPGPARARTAVDVHEEAADLHFLSGRMAEALRHASEGLEIAQAHGYTERLGPLYISLGGIGLFGWTPREEALERLKEGLQRCERVGDEAPLSRGYMHLGAALRHAGQWSEARSCFLRMIAIGAQHPETLGDVVGPSMLAHLALDTGRLGEARQYAEQALQAADAHESEWAVAFVSAFTSDVYFEVGELDEAERLAQRGLELGEQLKIAFAISNARATLGQVAFIRGEYRQALRHFKHNLAKPDGMLTFSACVRLGETSLALGRVGQAYRYANDALECEPSVKDVGRAERLMAVALLHHVPPELEQAQEWIQRAVQRYESLEMPLELGTSLVVAGRWAWLTGDERAAQHRFDQAWGLFDAAGADWRLADLERVQADLKTAATGVL